MAPIDLADIAVLLAAVLGAILILDAVKIPLLRRVRSQTSITTPPNQ